MYLSSIAAAFVIEVVAVVAVVSCSCPAYVRTFAAFSCSIGVRGGRRTTPGLTEHLARRIRAAVGVAVHGPVVVVLVVVVAIVSHVAVPLDCVVLPWFDPSVR